MTGNLATHDFAHPSSLDRGTSIAASRFAGLQRTLRAIVLRCLRLASYEAWAAGIGAVLTIAGIAFACTISAAAIAPFWGPISAGDPATVNCLLRAAFCVP